MLRCTIQDFWATKVTHPEPPHTRQLGLAAELIPPGWLPLFRNAAVDASSACLAIEASLSVHVEVAMSDGLHAGSRALTVSALSHFRHFDSVRVVLVGYSQPASVANGQHEPAAGHLR